jgi:pimeloyl-ACP methyl ester carboxylesterase
LKFDLFNEKSSSIPQNPIIILHGLFGSRSNNRSIAKELNSRLERDVYCLDLRNHGDSPHIARHDYPALAADVERFIADHGLGKSILIGHSMGAKTAMAVALRSNELVDMMISVDNAPVNLQPSSKFIEYVRVMQTLENNPEVTTSKEANIRFKAFEENTGVRQFLLQNFRKNKSTGMLKCRVPLKIMKDALVKGNIASWEFDPNYSNWFGPALFIRGTKSLYIPDEYLPDIGRFFPAFEVRDIEAGHWVMSEKPEESLDVLAEFIQRHDDV